ncbi:52 kDa repressor of the inhibitor of the protein kinase [Drosophila mojavensis]|uniref:THAP-type domain-containing protein n=1 Tax=Drosophila mojavensis TaxID=7230 RepID=B4KUS3_DROMO|nr:52 kDa repressor of the inhibitor of the protein kinase [Drosophila mojavensis]EDW19329.2 uncharacterized protein Dmoj_GI13719 [Drosophila mojavensis]
MRCAVRYCGNNNRNGNKKNWRYFHFPKDKQQLKKWIEFCERDITNPTTACICNEHFTPDDFERNMQYELGFTRKNPTKLKPGSYPTIHGPQTKLLLNNAKDKRRSCKDANPSSNHKKKQKVEENSNSSQLEQLTPKTNKREEEAAESGNSQYQSYEMIEYISESDDAPLTDEGPRIGRIELEIIDSLDPQTNTEEHVEIIESERDSYARHLECEVSSLRRQVFFLKDERKKLMDEIQSLRAIVQNARLKDESLESLNLANNKTIIKSKHRPPIKKTVMLYTANIDSIRKLRKINKND